ncbi:ubiquitin-related domain-containing protein [Cantharellus anzutake]|uniref:ubiquitin-related domain-containing protein n=1 Tax=Cantharellus anzutake TaxID=1750568 RepID=UPI0019035974|nr:ubiquitin-related domain-containing protein [Cantharellus anzutake]KAF8326203.1 ubiquitin-related domain-containing protein [Cantharellus anzutake]
MYITVKTSLGRHTIKAEPNDTINDFKQNLHHKTGIPPAGQRLLFNNRQLGDGWVLLSEYRIQDGSELSLARIRISVRGPTGRIHIFEAELLDTVSILKAKIYRRTGIPPWEQRFIFDGRQLEDQFTLSESGIQDEDVIHLAHHRRVTNDQLQC